MTLFKYIPNILSISRIVLIPLFIYLLVSPTFLARLMALAIFGIASLTDLLDGWSARKLNQESELGKFLDPLADKVLVVSALIAILVIDPYMELIDLWMILVIVGRDVLITAMRYQAIKRGKSLKTSSFGKIKTAFQMISIVLIILIYMLRKTEYDFMHKSIPWWILLFLTMLTAISGLRYLKDNWQLFFPEKKPEMND